LKQKLNKVIKVRNLEQRNLFGELLPPTIAIEESANRLGVSTATIRNWIKTKYLEQVGKGRITLSSSRPKLRNALILNVYKNISAH
jgi:transposase